MLKHMFPRKGDVGIFERQAPVGFIFEPKLDSIRVFLYKEEENIKIFDQNNRDVLFKFPEMLDVYFDINANRCVLDGILIFLEEGKPNSLLLQERELAETKSKIKTHSKRWPAKLFVFDILQIEDALLLDLPLKKRREFLEKTITNSEVLGICPYSLNGKALWKEVKEKNYEGLIAKNLSGKYSQGKSWEWLKIQNFETKNLIVSGITEKSFLLSYYDKTGKLLLFGELNKDQNTKQLEKYIKKRYKEIKTKENFFDLQERDVKWIKPEIVVKVRLDENRIDLIRVRLDKLPFQCVAEDEI
ncbi:MAG: hypothetical protein NZ889_00975 [Candidatus Pacearchaeota archaeon]|nr:hypothetical protein [Candidatus Pacearchaeota archaeon]